MKKNWMRICLISAAFLGAMGNSAWVQAAPTNGPIEAPSAEAGTKTGRMHERMREHMGAHHAQRLNEIKAKLHLDASQEAAWKTFSDAMQPPQHGTWADRASLEKMSTPERVDHMQARHEHMRLEMKKRGDAAKTFYASLNGDQKKIFDTESLRMIPGADDRRMRHHSH